MISLSSIGVHDCLVKAVMKSDMDLRRVLLSQMVLSGGSTLFPGYFNFIFIAITLYLNKINNL